jgi:hypothetical protein
MSGLGSWHLTWVGPYITVLEMGQFVRAGSVQSPTQNLARGSWVLSGPIRPGPDFGWPDPARIRFWVARPSPNQKKCIFSWKIGQKWAKIGQNRWPEVARGQKRLARTGPRPKKSGPSLTRAKNGQPEPDPGHKKSGPTQPYNLWIH